MSSEFVDRGEFVVGYVRPRGQALQPVIGTVANGRVVVQGCIILGTVDEMRELGRRANNNPVLFKDSKASLQGSVIEGQGVRWDEGRVPYVISKDMFQPDRVENAIAHWNEKLQGVVSLTPHKGEADFIEFVQVASGCASAVGRIGGRQEIWISSSCSKGNVIHEIGHALGLWHEQSRIDRDEHVEILWQNIDPAYRSNFDQHIHDGRDVNGYDFSSIMHYPIRAFSINDEPTIKARQPLPPGVVLGQRNGLSAGDIATIRAIYNAAA